MDEEIYENSDVDFEEIYENYEFDASQFYDFTRPESDYEIEEAERWFEVWPEYDLSPFDELMNMENEEYEEYGEDEEDEEDGEEELYIEDETSASTAKSINNEKLRSTKSDTNSSCGVLMSKKNGKGTMSHFHFGERYMLQDTARAKKNSANMLSKPRSSTLMKPTASHLAKQNKLLDTDSSSVVTRSQKLSTSSSEKNSQSSSGLVNLASKRQKLEIGYLRKIAHLKHQISFLHKSSKKVTIPREPELETLVRAQRRSSKNSSASRKNEKEKECDIKPRPLNRKSMESPSLPQQKKKTPQSTKFQVFHLKTMDRANQHASAKVSTKQIVDPGVSDDTTYLKRQNSRGTLKPLKKETYLNSKACFPREKESKTSVDNKLMGVVPLEQIIKISMGGSNNVSQAVNKSMKGLKENMPCSLEEILRCDAKAKSNTCGAQMRLREARCQANMTRSLHIR